MQVKSTDCGKESQFDVYPTVCPLQKTLYAHCIARKTSTREVKRDPGMAHSGHKSFTISIPRTLHRASLKTTSTYTAGLRNNASMCEAGVLSQEVPGSWLH